MARIRTIKPGFWTDEKLAEVPRTTRLTFAGLFSTCADDLGRFKANPRVVRGMVYPLDDTVTAAEIQAELEQLVKIGVVELYTVNGEMYGRILKWAKHQKIDRPSMSQLPDPPAIIVDDSSNNQRTIDEGSTKVHNGAERSGAERNGEEEIGKRAERKGGSKRSDDAGTTTNGEGIGSGKAGTLARWLAHFYADADSGRRDQVREQLTVLYRGGEVRFKKGSVHALSVEHLEAKAEEMLDVAFSIDKRDRAIAILLLKLQDQVKDSLGRLPGEAMAEATKAQERLADSYETERKKAIANWYEVHPTEHDGIEGMAREAMTTDQNNIGFRAELTMRMNALVAERLGFPDFEVWIKHRKAS